MLTAGFAELILCIEYRITQLLARIEEDVFKRSVYSEEFLKCIEPGIVSGEISAADGSFLPSNVSWDSRYEAVEPNQRSTIKYMEELEAELSSMPGYKEPRM